MCGVCIIDDLATFVPFLSTHKWGVIWWYAKLGYTEKLSTDGVLFEKRLDKLLQCQFNTLIGSRIKRLQVEADTVPWPPEDNAREVRSVNR